jgi:DNA-binding SARP family transcriptional activator/CheY-like chemotaxis protein
MILKNLGIIGGTPHQTKTIDQAISVQFAVRHFQDVQETELERCDIILVFHDPLLYNGLETLTHIRRKFPLLPVVLLGASVQQHDIVEAFRLGASDFLFLPLDYETLLDCLYRFLPTSTSRSRQGWRRYVPSFVRRFFEHAPSLSNVAFSATTIPTPAALVTPVATAPDVQVQLLGNLNVTVQGKRLPNLPGRKNKAILAYLLYKHPKPIHKELLIEQFWADSTLDSARNCLNVALHAIRKCFEKVAPNVEVIAFQDECYQLNPKLMVERDVDLFEQYWKKGRQIELENGMEAAIDTYHQAFAFYRGDFLEELPYQEWAERERDKFRETWLVILDRLSAHFFEKGRYQICLNLCKKILEKDECIEETHRRLMECYVRLGMREMAIRQYQKCKLSLSEELSVAPGKATCELYEKIREN